MTAQLKTVSLEGYERIFSGEASSEETQETVVPDTMPDIARIADADALVTLRSKIVDAGKVTAGGYIEAWTLYVPEDGTGLRVIKTGWQFQISADAPGADTDCLASVRVELGAIDAKMLNPRKILVRAELRMGVDCCRKSVGEHPVGAEDADALGIVLRTESVQTATLSSVTEKTFVVTDEFAFPASEPPVAEYVGCRVSVRADEVKPIGTKLIVRGAASSSVNYLDAGGILRSRSFETSFSQLVETETDMGDASARVSLMLTGAYVETVSESEPRSFKAELHLVAQVAAESPVETQYITDAYSTAYALTSTRETACLMAAPDTLTLRETLRQRLSGAGSAATVLSARASVSSARLAGDRAECAVFLRCVYADAEGAVYSVSGREKVVFDLSGAAGSTRYIEALCGETFAEAADGGVELRVPVELRAYTAQTRSLDVVRGIELGDALPPAGERPSLTLTHTAPTRGLWELAKRYGSTVEAIREANGLGESDPQDGMLLLVPTVF